MKIGIRLSPQFVVYISLALVLGCP